jgi:hypothetical protein
VILILTPEVIKAGLMGTLLEKSRAMEDIGKIASSMEKAAKI